MKTCIIKITPDHKTTPLDIQTNGVNKLEIVDFLESLVKVLARQIVEEARQHVGDDPKAQEKWIDSMRQKPDQN